MVYKHLPKDLPARFRAAGLTVVEVDGWYGRGRPASTGAFNPVGVGWHHTGGASDGLAYAEWMACVGRSDLPAPLCQIAIDRKGIVYVLASGRANHAGRARAAGSVAAGDGNELYAGVEVMLTGTEVINAVQYGAMVSVGAVLAGVLGTSVRAQNAHREISVTGKWDIGDPQGVMVNGSRVMDMDKFRAAIAGRIKTLKSGNTVAVNTTRNITAAIKALRTVARTGSPQAKTVARDTIARLKPLQRR